MRLLKKLLLIGSFAAVTALWGCGSKDPGTPPEVLIADTKVVVGETKPSELVDQGFVLDDLGKMILELPERSWVQSIFLEKDDASYASLTLVNASKEKVPVNNCVIEEVSFYALEDKKKEDLNISINGVNPIGMTQEELKTTYPDLELDDDTGDFLFHYLKSGDYSVRFQYSQGVLNEILVSHSFEKSYQTK